MADKQSGVTPRLLFYHRGTVSKVALPCSSGSPDPQNKTKYGADLVIGYYS